MTYLCVAVDPRALGIVQHRASAQAAVDGTLDPQAWAPPSR